MLKSPSSCRNAELPNPYINSIRIESFLKYKSKKLRTKKTKPNLSKQKHLPRLHTFPTGVTRRPQDNKR